MTISIGGSKRGARDAPHGGPNSFIFMQFSSKKLISTPILGMDPPPLQENPGSVTGQKATYLLVNNSAGALKVKSSAHLVNSKWRLALSSARRGLIIGSGKL